SMRTSVVVCSVSHPALLFMMTVPWRPISVCPGSKNTSLSAGSSTYSWVVVRDGSAGAGAGVGDGREGEATAGGVLGAGGFPAGASDGEVAAAGGDDGADEVGGWAVFGACSAQAPKVNSSITRRTCDPRWEAIASSLLRARLAAGIGSDPSDASVASSPTDP